MKEFVIKNKNNNSLNKTNFGQRNFCFNCCMILQK